MTLLSELTDKYSKQTYFASLNTYKEKYVPTIFGHHLYTFLYKLLSDFDHKVNFVEIIKPEDSNIEKLFVAELKNYSPDIVDYESVWEISDWFPQDELLQDKDLRLKITNMIRKIKFVNSSIKTDHNYTCYLPLCGDKLNLLLSKNKYNFTIFTNISTSRLYHDKLIKLERSKLKKVRKELTKIKDSYQKIFDENIREARYYKAPKYLDNFNDSYIEDLKRAKYDSENKKLYFFGSETYTAKEGIDYLLGSHNYREYDLYESIKDLHNDERSFVFLNFHQLFSQNRQNDLAEIIQENKLKSHIAIQGDNLKLISFFSNYRRVSVPDENEIRSLISGIFISFLIHKNKYTGRPWTLYPFAKHRLLDNLLSDVTSPQALLEVIGNIEKVSINDLLENTSFWYMILDKYSEADKEINKNKVDIPLPPVEKWVIEITDDNQYRILSPHVDTGPQKHKKFITYLLLLIKYIELKNEPMSVDLLRKSIIKYDGDSVPEEIKLETARIATTKMFNKAINDNDWFNTFYSSYIKYDSYEYNLNLSLIDLTIIGFEIKPNFYENLKSLYVSPK